MMIYEASLDGRISEDTRNEMLRAYTEGLSLNPLKKFKERIAEIKKAKPSEYSDNAEVKKFVDKHYDDIIKVSNLLEKEPDKLRRSDIRYMVTAIVEFIGAMGIYIAGVASAGLVGVIAGLVAMLLTIIHEAIRTILVHARVTNDIKVSDDLAKIRAALKKVNVKKLPKEYAKKISDMITAIDDAETEINSRVKVTNESTDDIRLSIYEKEMNGEITMTERDALLQYLEAKIELDNM